MHTISVVIPCYNSANTIEKCIISVLEQTHAVNEIIVIDDGSSDATCSLVHDIISNNKTNCRIILLTQANAGPSVARNKGIKEAKGEWIAFLDSDDIWPKNKIEKQIEVLKQFPSVALIGVGSTRKTQKISFNKLIFKNYFQTSTTMVRKDVVEKYYFNENQKYGEDYRLWLEIGYVHEMVISNQEKAINVLPLNLKSTSLSKNFSAMEKGEISNFKFLLSSNKITKFTFIVICLWSYLKYFRRVIINNFFLDYTIDA